MKKIYLTAGTLFAFCFCFSQDVHFVNTQQSLLYLNPSFAGSNGFIRNQTNYRNEWLNSGGPTAVPYINSLDAYIRPIKGGIAGSVLVDDQGNGTLKTTWYNLVYAQYFSLGKIKIVPSAQLGYVNLALDKTKLNFGDVINARYGESWTDDGKVRPWGFHPIPERKYNFNFSSGLLAYYQDLIFGASVFNIFSPDIGLIGQYSLPVRICLNASYNIKVNSASYLNLSSVFNKQDKWWRMQFFATYNYKKIFAGIGTSSASNYWSNNNGQSYAVEAIASIGLHLKYVNLSYCYNHSFAKANYSLSSHEISLSFNFKSKKDTLSKIGMEYW